MTEEMQDLLKKFREIKKMHYVKSVGKGSYAVGDTFETLLGKKRDEFFLPDYLNIEIKVKSIYNRQTLALFNAEADGIDFFANQKLVNTYGYSRKNSNVRFFFLEVNGKEKIKYIKNYFQIAVDYNQEVIVLNVFDLNGNLIDSSTTWSFALLKERLNLKLNNLALVRYYKIEKNQENYYWYYSIEFFQNIIFSKFLEEIENGNVTICFSFDEFKNGPRKGQQHNHGTNFKINQDSLKNIYQQHYAVEK